MKRRFLILFILVISGSIVGSAAWITNLNSATKSLLDRTSGYLGLITLVIGATVVVRLAQAFLYIYLFFSHMVVGVPRLIANIFTLLFSVLIFGWLGAEVFQIRVAPLIATSAVFSVVLGLALQETLGNLFSGVSLQLERPYNLGDWVEVQNGTQKWIGQIQEISWRSTVLMGFMDELISIPNRTMALSQVIIFTHPQRPARRVQAFRFEFGTPIEKAKLALLEAVVDVPEVLPEPRPTVLVIDTTESWVSIKLFYSVVDFGAQYRVGDEVISRALASVERAGLKLAPARVALINSDAL